MSRAQSKSRELRRGSRLVHPIEPWIKIVQGLRWSFNPSDSVAQFYSQLVTDILREVSSRSGGSFQPWGLERWDSKEALRAYSYQAKVSCYKPHRLMFAAGLDTDPSLVRLSSYITYSMPLLLGVNKQQ